MLIASFVLLIYMIGAILLAKQPNSLFLYNFHGESLLPSTGQRGANLGFKSNLGELCMAISTQL